MLKRRLKIRIAVNAAGYRIGDSHHRAKLSDHEVELVLQLRAIGWSYEAIARKLDVGKSCVAKIIRGENRAQTPADWREVPLKRRR